MKSIKLLEEQIEIYDQLTKEKEQRLNEISEELEKYQEQYDNYKGKLDGLKHLLEVVKEDFESVKSDKITEEKIENKKLVGVVEWFNAEKGYGFIKTDEQSVFAHFADIICEGFKCLDEGDDVEFYITDGQRGPQAREITKISK
jgi:CspA family cold shock protein